MTIEYSAKKFSDLTQITAGAITNGDLLAITDVSESTSSKITFGEFTSAILSDTNLQNKATTIVSKINAINANTSLNNALYASALYYNGEYRTGEYVMAWGNISGKPDLPVDLTDLQNSTNYISYVDNETDANLPGTMRVVARTGNFATDRTMITDFLSEGSDNLYFTNERVDIRLDAKFGQLFNQFSSTFDGGFVIDSLQDVQGIFQNINQSNESNVIRVMDTSLARFYKAGQILRLFGASLDGELLTSSPAAPQLSIEGVTPFGAGSGAGSVQLLYRMAFFNLIDGKISPLSPTTTVSLENGGNNPMTAFNSNNFVKFSGLPNPNNQGIIIYRKIDGTDLDFKLLAVLGPKDLSGDATWQDYNTFDFTAWSGKNPTSNVYDDITHFPLTVYSGGLRGWADVSVKAVALSATHFDIILGTATPDVDQTVFVNPNNFLVNGQARTVQIAHNDTAKINEAIQGKAAAGSKSITLNAKNYIATHIRVPDNFGLVGTANVTTVSKMPWSTYRGDVPDNSLVKSQTSAGASTISIFGIDLDGNLKNQCRLIDTVDDSANYLVDLGVGSDSILVDRCRFKNMIAGGIFAISTNEFRMSTSEVLNSGVTDRYPELDTPLSIGGGRSNMVIGNRFENFAGSVDVSVTSDGIVSNNIIRACGSGLNVYGSTFLVSSPNVLIGAANEFLDSPDILNTTYDSINIPIVKFAETAGPYKGDRFTYQENGDPFDLTYTATSAQSAILVYRLNLVQQLADGSTQVYANQAGPNIKDINGNTGIPLIVGKRYRIVNPGTWGEANWVAAGAKVGMTNETFTCISGGAMGGGAVVSPNEFVGTTTDAPAEFTNLSSIGAVNLDASLGQWSFQILEGEKAKLYTGFMSPALLQGAYNARRGNEATTPGSFPGYIEGSTHLGVAWSCSYRYMAEIATIKSGLWYVHENGATQTTVQATSDGSQQGFKVDLGGDNPERDAIYKMNVSSPIDLVPGMEVSINGHGGFVMPSTRYGVITSVTANADDVSVEVRFYNAIPSGQNGVTLLQNGGLVKGNNNPNGNGTLNTIDDFVLGQGLIK